MGKTVVESHYSRFKPVRQDERCAFCSCGCKTSCVRPPMEIEHSKDTEDQRTYSQSEKK